MSISKFSLLLVVLFILPFNVFAQQSNTVSGQVFDATSNEPLSYSTISILSAADSAFINGTVSNTEGFFTISGIQNGSYILKFSYIGYSSKFQNLLIGELNTFFNLGKINVSPSNLELNELTVEAQREIVSAGLEQRTFDVGGNIAQSSGSVLNVMKTMPGVTVDQEGKIILRGSDKVAVLIDGKQSSLTGFGNQKALDNIPAANIERIEIINNPSAKYDASGMAGIINIIYKKEKETGLSGDIGLSFGLGAFTEKARADVPTNLGSFQSNPKAIPSLNLNYRTKKLNYFLQSQVILQKVLPNNEFTIRNYTNGDNTISQVPENRKQVHYIVNGGIDWNINESNLITFSGVYDFEHHIDTAQVAFIDQNLNNRYRYYSWQEDEKTGFFNLSTVYQHKFKTAGQTLDASIQFSQGWEDETYALRDSSSVRVGRDKTNIIAIENTLISNVDFVKPLESGRIETGAQIRVRRLPVDYTITPGTNSILYDDVGDHSTWGEDIFAAYANYVWEKPLYDIEAGLRVEQTNVFYNLDPANVYYPSNDKYNYLRLFPSIRLTLKINEDNRVSAFYNRRVDRTGEPELRVYPKFDDPELIKVGNPYLRPQFTHTTEVAFKHFWEKGSVFVAGFHRMIDDPYMRIFSEDNSNANYTIINKVYQNTGSATNTGIEMILAQNLDDWGKLSGSLNWYNNRINKFTGTVLFPYQRPFTIQESDDNTWDFKLNGLFQLSEQIEFQITGIYYAPKNIPQGEEFARSSIDFGFKKTILDNRGELTFSVSDLFNNFGIRQDIIEDTFTARYENNYETQIVRLGFKYKF